MEEALALFRGIVPYRALVTDPCDPEVKGESAYDCFQRMVRVLAGTERIGYDALFAVIGIDHQKWMPSLHALVAFVAAKHGRLDEALAAYPDLLEESQRIFIAMQQHPAIWRELERYWYQQQE